MEPRNRTENRTNLKSVLYETESSCTENCTELDNCTELETELSSKKSKIKKSKRAHLKKVLSNPSLVGNSVFGFRFLGRPEFGIPLPSSEFRNFPAENQIGKPENRSSRKSEFRFPFSGFPEFR